MDCVGIQKCIGMFIDDKLSLQELEAFLEHMDSCGDCREEYDVYYTLLMGMRILDEEDTIQEKFHIDSREKLEMAREYLQKKKGFRALERILCIILIMVMVFSMG